MQRGFNGTLLDLLLLRNLLVGSEIIKKLTKKDLTTKNVGFMYYSTREWTALFEILPKTRRKPFFSTLHCHNEVKEETLEITFYLATMYPEKNTSELSVVLPLNLCRHI